MLGMSKSESHNVALTCMAESWEKVVLPKSCGHAVAICGHASALYSKVSCRNTDDKFILHLPD